MTTKQQAAALRRKVALKGQSRSHFCAAKVGRSGICQRLEGHKGEHRLTLSARKPVVKAEPVAEPQAPVKPVKVIPEAPAKGRTQRIRSARRPKAAPKVAAEA